VGPAPEEAIMMPHGKLLMGAWGTSALVALLSLRAWWTQIPPASPYNPPALKSPGAAPPVDTARLGTARRTLERRDPFRLARSPASARYDPWAPAQPPVVATPRPNRPVLTLAGIVGGPPWQALVEGIPGRPAGVLLRAGDKVEGIRLEALRGDTALLTGMDTTWVLVPRKVWR
jgi:hypothetical protein